MGFLKHLLFWPVTGPLYLSRFSMEKVQGVVRDELTDDTRVKEALMDLQLRLELEEINDETYAAEEDRLMAELRDVRRWREEFGMGTRGGVVQVASEEGSAGAEVDPAGTGAGEDESALDREAEGEGRRGVASPEGASIDVHFGFDEER